MFFGLGLKNDIKAILRRADKKEIDYGLEKLIVKAERLPIYLNWYDFHRGKFNPLDPILGNFQEKIRVNRIEANRNRAEEKIRQIHKIFDPVMETMRKDLLHEKDPERAERIAEEYRKAQNIVNDLETRVQKWSDAGDQVLYCEYNLPTQRLIANNCDVINYPNSGIYVRLHYSKENIHKNLKALYEAEKHYEKFNNGRGLKAWQIIVKKIYSKEANYWEENKEAKENKPQFNELPKPSERKPIQERLDETFRDRAGKGEETTANSPKAQKLSCQGKCK